MKQIIQELLYLNRQQATGNRQQATGNRQQATGNTSTPLNADKQRLIFERKLFSLNKKCNQFSTYTFCLLAIILFNPYILHSQTPPPVRLQFCNSSPSNPFIEIVDLVEPNGNAIHLSHSNLNGSNQNLVNIKLTKDLIIDQNVTFSSCNFKISPNVKIIINSSVTFTSNGSWYFSCGQPWQGINNFGIAEFNGGRLEDAINFLSMENGSTNSFKGCYIQFNKTFLKNGNTKNFTLKSFNNNKIVGGGQVLPGIGAQIGIRLNSAGGVSINSSGLPFNQFNNLQVGIALDNGNYSIFECRFKGNVTGVSCLGSSSISNLTIKGVSSDDNWDFDENYIGVNTNKTWLDISDAKLITSRTNGKLISCKSNVDVTELKIKKCTFQADALAQYAIDMDSNSGEKGSLIDSCLFISNNSNSTRRVINVVGSISSNPQPFHNITNNVFQLKKVNSSAQAVIYIDPKKKRNYRIVNNTMTSHYSGGYHGYGITFIGSVGGAQLVANNTIHGSTNSAINEDFVCCYHQETAQNGTTICSNDFDNSIMGTHFDKGCINTALNLEQNHYHKHTTCIRLGYLDVNGNTIITPQNCRDNTFEYGGSIDCLNPNNVAQNRFIVRKFSNDPNYIDDQYHFNSISPAIDPMDLDPWISESENCNSGNLTCAPYTFNLINLPSRFWQETNVPLNPDLTTTSLRWEEAMSYYLFIKENPTTFTGNQQIQNWLSAIESNTIIDNEYQSDLIINQILNYSQTQQNNLNTLMISYNNDIEVLNLLLYQEEQQTQPDPILTAQILQIRQALATTSNQIESIHQARVTAMNAAYTAALQYWDNVSSSSPLEQWHILIQKALLVRALQNDPDYQPINYSAIKDIAMKCFKEAGSAASLARTFLTPEDLQLVTHDELRSDCYGTGSRNNDNPKINTKLSVTPNPASTRVRLNVPSDFGIFDCILLDMNGKEVFKYKGLTNQSELSIDHVISGIYFIKVSDSTSGKSQQALFIKN